MAESSIGVQIQYSTDGTNWSGAGCITEADLGGMTKEVGEGQCLSDTDRWKTFFGKFADAGEMTFSIQWDPEDYTALIGMVPDEDPIHWRIVVPDGDPSDPATCSRLQAMGLVTNLGMTFPGDGDRVTAPVTIKLSGAPTFTEAP